MGIDCCCDATGKIIGAVVAAEQWDDRGAILRDGDDGRFRVLVGEQRRQNADQCAGGHHRDDRPAGGKERRQMRFCLVESDIDMRGAGAGAVEFCTDRIGNPAAERMARLGQDDDGGF